MSMIDGGHRPRRWLRVSGRFVLGALLVIALVALGGLAGYLGHQALPRTWTASTTVLVLPTASGLDTSVSGARTSADVQIDTEAAVMTSASVADNASTMLKGSDSAKSLLKNSTVTVPPNSQVLIVAYSSTTPVKARDGSMALAQSYLARRTKLAADEVKQVKSGLTTQLADLNKQLKSTTTALAAVAPDNQAQRALLDAQRSLLVSQIADLNSRLVAMDFGASTGGDIVTKAQLPDRPTTPSQMLLVGAGAGAGLLLSAGLLLGLSQMRSRRRAVVDRTSAVRVPVLATLALTYPDASTSEGPQDASDLVDEKDALRRLSVKVSSFHGVRGPTVIVGVGDAELRTQLAAELNRSWASEFGGSVLVLTEAALPAASIAGAESDALGLREVLRGDLEVSEAVQVEAGSRAGIMGPGRDLQLVPTSAQRLLLPEVWTVLERDFGNVVVQTGSVLDSPLAQSVAMSAGRFIVLVEVGVGQRRDLTSTLEEIEWLELIDRVAGVVIVSKYSASESLDAPMFDALPRAPRPKQLPAKASDRGRVARFKS